MQRTPKRGKIILKTFLTSDEIKQMIDAATNLRDKLIVSFLADTGCRVSEMVGIKTDQIDWDRELVLIRHLKRGLKKKCPQCERSAGRVQSFCSKCGADIGKVEPEGEAERSRLINVGSDVLELVQEYLGARSNDTDRLIPVTRQMVYYVIRALAHKADLQGRALINPASNKKHYVHPHSMRDALAIDWLTEVKDTEGQKALQEHLGHQSFDTTARYMKLAPERRRDISDKVRKKRFG